ncbi:M48 family metallopeptidase [Coprobacter tertius]|uniref:M48 family metallopeptidase n=1 Tax=Coprobacter tertius TaxID=2944915 RepID=A0ABT1MIY1_9BACT|nr:YgjP-like metallopeptidase domain-containing protein [Coprobacter tertius]MCP9612580.1 M48 family metallopeptidase [Coprobacter tertius]
MESQIIQDSEFGEIVLHPRRSARNFIFRIKDGRLVVTVPFFATEKDILQSVDSSREKLRKIFKKAMAEDLTFKVGDVIATRNFLIVVRGSNRKKMAVLSGDGCLFVECPEDIDMDSKAVQSFILSAIKRYIKRSGESYLPSRLQELAEKVGVRYSGVSITYGRNRLGKCDSRGHISLSYYLMLLPDRLIDYIIFHELAHLTEMNHGARFHRLCDRYCEGNEFVLRRELRKFRFPIP